MLGQIGHLKTPKECIQLNISYVLDYKICNYQ